MPGSNRAVFLDRDGTIVEDPGYLTSPDQLKLLDGAAEAVARLRKAGFLVILATNQSAIAKGLMTEADLAAIHKRLAELLEADDPNAKFDGIYFCPFHPEAKVSAYRQESYLRKPRPGMLFKAAREHQLDLGSCWMVGDSERDVQAGKTAGARAIRLHHDPETETMADYVRPSLAVAADTILLSPGRTPLRSTRHGEHVPPPAPAAEVQPVADPQPVAEPHVIDEPQVVEESPLPEEPREAVPAEIATEPFAIAEPTAETLEATAVESSGQEPAIPLESAEPAESAAVLASSPAEPQDESTPSPAAPVQAITAASAEPLSEPTAETSAETAGRLNLSAPTQRVGSTRARLLRQIEEERKAAEEAAARGDQGEEESEPVAPDALTADKPTVSRSLNTRDVRHVLAEILQQLRQLNRGPNKHAFSATKVLGGLFQMLSWTLLLFALILMSQDAQVQRAIVWALAGVFTQLASLFFFTMFKAE